MNNETILDEVKKLIYSDRRNQYGSISESMGDTIKIFNQFTGYSLSIKEAIIFMICHKLARESFKHKKDNIVDAIGYLALLNDYIENDENEGDC